MSLARPIFDGESTEPARQRVDGYGVTANTHLHSRDTRVADRVVAKLITFASSAPFVRTVISPEQRGTVSRLSRGSQGAGGPAG